MTNEEVQAEIIEDVSTLDAEGGTNNEYAHNAEDIIDELGDDTENPELKADKKTIWAIYKAIATGQMNEQLAIKAMELVEKYGAALEDVFYLANKAYMKGQRLNPSFEAVNRNWKTLGPIEQQNVLEEALEFLDSHTYTAQKSTRVIRPVVGGAAAAVQLGAWLAEFVSGKDGLATHEVMPAELIIRAILTDLMETSDEVIIAAFEAHAEKTTFKTVATSGVNLAARTRVANAGLVKAMMGAGSKLEQVNRNAMLRVRADVQQDRIRQAQIEAERAEMNTTVKEFHDAEVNASTPVSGEAPNNNKHFDLAA